MRRLHPSFRRRRPGRPRARPAPRPVAALACALALACAAPLPPELDLDYAAAARRAAEDERRAPGFEPRARKKIRPKLFRGALDCGLFGQDVGLVLAVAADGAVAAAYVEPSNPRTRCLARRARRAELPPPPFAPFFVGASTLDPD